MHDGETTKAGRKRARRALGNLGLAAALAAGAVLLAGPSLAAQETELTFGGLLRAGIQTGDADLDRRAGFRIYDARLRTDGRTGHIFDFFAQAEFDADDQRFLLLDVGLDLEIRPEASLRLGLFKVPFGREQLLSTGDIPFIRRAQISNIVPPGRNLGARIGGAFLEERLEYRAGIFNGNGRRFGNDNGAFLYAARVQYNTIGPAAFYDDLVIQVGANAAFSRDSAVDLSGGGSRVARSLPLHQFTGDRFLLGLDFESSYRGLFLRGEYLRGEFDPAESALLAEPPTLDEGEEEATTVIPAGGGETLVARGGYIEGGYDLWGAAEGILRYDAANDFLLFPRGGDFLVFGLNLHPGFVTKLGLQYSVGLAGAEVGAGVSSNEFAFNAQVAF